ncbi:MAG: 2-dehydropantoate 2-reductase [Chloroflexota bacterium]|nr:2-dehydropantoate 2-reductase [Chloroflexota bacterium]
MKSLNFVIVGAGATGGFLGARLARASEDVTLVARGPHLAAMRANGVRVIGTGDDFVAHPACTDDLSVVGSADVVFLTVKAHALSDLAPRLGPLLGPDTAVVTAQNGIPWWYFDRLDDEARLLAGTRLHSADPEGVIAASIEARRVIGCVVYPATQLVAPGVIEHLEGTRFSIGEPDGSKTPRCQAIAAALVRAGLKSPIRTRIRHDVWLKLLGNVAFNPISALTRATLVDIATHPQTRAAARAVMEEADSVARALGVKLEIGVDQRLEGAEQVGAHKTSMLQDVETGRPLEVEALLGTVVEIGDLLGLDLPHLRTVYACTQLLDVTLRG